MNFKKKLLHMVSSAALLGAVTTSSFATQGDKEEDKLDKISFLNEFPEGGTLPDAWQDKVVNYASVLALESPDAPLPKIYSAAYDAIITSQLSYVFNYHVGNGSKQYVLLPMESRPMLFAQAIQIMRSSFVEMAPNTTPLSMAFDEREKEQERLILEAQQKEEEERARLMDLASNALKDKTSYKVSNSGNIYDIKDQKVLVLKRDIGPGKRYASPEDVLIQLRKVV